jgi:hypothetical protein
MNEDKLAEKLARAEASLDFESQISRPCTANAIRELHARRQSRKRSVAVASVGLAAIFVIYVRSGLPLQVEPRQTHSSEQVVIRKPVEESKPGIPQKSNDEPAFEVANLSDPVLNFQIDMDRERIAQLLVDHARFRRSRGRPESEWRDDLAFVQKLYPRTIAAELARSEFASESGSNH